MILSHFHSCLQALWSLSTALRQEWALNCLITGPVRICCLGNRMDMNDHESCESWMYFICHRELGLKGYSRCRQVIHCPFCDRNLCVHVFYSPGDCYSSSASSCAEAGDVAVWKWMYGGRKMKKACGTCTIYDKDEQIEMMILIRMMTMMTIIMIYIYVGMTKLLSWW